MNQITLQGTDIRVSRFSFGTAGLFNASLSARERGRLLNAAYDAGFTHFDTAPYYAFGIAERDLRPFLASRPNATVTTKVGLYSRRGSAADAFGVPAQGRRPGVARAVAAGDRLERRAGAGAAFGQIAAAWTRARRILFAA
jgi:aryl-alcohol dehydrogenase-like predicted oxidoreductase